MQSVDLGWLKYVGYLFWFAAFVFYIAARVDVRRLSKGWKGLVCAASIFLGSLLSFVQEHHAQTYSPRLTVFGPIVRLHEESQGKSSYGDEFVLALPQGGYSPLLETDVLGSRSSHFRPLSKGDTLAVTYRLWDEKILTIDVIEGRHPGWTFRYSSDSGFFVVCSSVALLGGFAYFAWQWNQNRQGDEVANDPEPAPRSDIVTLGLDDAGHDR